VLLILSLSACSWFCPTPAPPSPPLSAQQILERAAVVCKDEKQLADPVLRKSCNEVGTREYLGGVFNFTVVPFGSPSGPEVPGTVQAISDPGADGYPRWGVQRTCLPAGSVNPFRQKAMDTGKPDELYPWKNFVPPEDGEKCKDNPHFYLSFARCDSDTTTPEPSCFKGSGTPTNAPPTADSLHDGQYLITATNGSKADLVVQAVEESTKIVGGKRLETWCVHSGFGWPSDSVSWSSFEMVSSNVNPTALMCKAKGDVMLTFNTSVVP
jgi:hypothetical protein